jgi:hypothetical protein
MELVRFEAATLLYAQRLAYMQDNVKVQFVIDVLKGNYRGDKQEQKIAPRRGERGGAQSSEGEFSGNFVLDWGEERADGCVGPPRLL